MGIFWWCRISQALFKRADESECYWQHRNSLPFVRCGIKADQLQRTSDMRYIIETTKTDAGTRVLPITEDVAQMFQAIIEDRNAPKVEKSIDGYSGFLFMIRECHLWQCTGNTASITWLADTMISTECRCQTTLHMYADTLTAPIWQNREWILRRCSISWGIRI